MEKVKYTILQAIWNKGQPKQGQPVFSVEPSNGGGIEFEGETLDAAVTWVKDNGGIVEYVL